MLLSGAPLIFFFFTIYLVSCLSIAWVAMCYDLLLSYTKYQTRFAHSIDILTIPGGTFPINSKVKQTCTR